MEEGIGDNAVLIQWLNADEEWVDHGLCDPDKAGRLVGWGKNSKFYRAVHPITKELFELVNPPTTDEWWGEVHDTKMTAIYAEKEIAQMIAGTGRKVYRFTRHLVDE